MDTPVVAMQPYFKEDNNSFTLHQFGDWIGKTLPEKAFVRIFEDGKVKLQNVGGRHLVSASQVPRRRMYHLNFAT